MRVPTKNEFAHSLNWPPEEANSKRDFSLLEMQNSVLLSIKNKNPVYSWTTQEKNKRKEDKQSPIPASFQDASIKGVTGGQCNGNIGLSVYVDYGTTFEAS